LVFSAVLAASATTACSTYHDELSRGQRAFETNDHDRTLAILRDLEPDVKRLPPAEQAEYAYLRGMTDYRVGYRSDARHWLSMAKAMEEGSPGMLPADWKERINEALGVLNDVVYTQGTSALLTTRTDDTAEPKEPKETRKREPHEQGKDGAGKSGKDTGETKDDAGKAAPAKEEPKKQAPPPTKD
jgi:hypothetical protein